MKQLFRCITAVLFGASMAHAATDAPKTAYDFSFETIAGEPMPLADYKGKLLLIVNTASECGFTGQYAGLQKLYETYHDQGLVIIGVPSNDFGGQEPGSNGEIKKFCESKFRVTFPLAAKAVISGDDAHPFYKWARAQKGLVGAPKWNFHKYLVSTKGELIDYFNSTTSPDADNLQRAIKANLTNE